MSLVGQCRWDIDVVWGGRSGQCPEGPAKWGGWLAGAIVRFILTLLFSVSETYSSGVKYTLRSTLSDCLPLADMADGFRTSRTLNRFPSAVHLIRIAHALRQDQRPTSVQACSAYQFVRVIKSRPPKDVLILQHGARVKSQLTDLRSTPSHSTRQVSIKYEQVSTERVRGYSSTIRIVGQPRPSGRTAQPNVGHFGLLFRRR